MGVMTIEQIGKSLLDEKYFVDTNVWVYQAYFANKVIGAELQEVEKQKLSDYSAFLQKVKQDGGKLYTSSLCLSELGHFIEKQAYQHYKKTNPSILLKDFRAIQTQRKIILQDIEQAWEDIKSLAEILPFHIESQIGDKMVAEMKKYPLDAYDALFLLTMNQHKITNIISDDRDFHSISYIDIYTV